MKNTEYNGWSRYATWRVTLDPTTKMPVSPPPAEYVKLLFQRLIDQHDLSLEGEPLYPDCRVEHQQIIFEDEGMMYLMAGYVSSPIFDDMETMLADKLGIAMTDSDGTIMTFKYI